MYNIYRQYIRDMKLAKMPPQPGGTFRFLDLPAELRCIVYRHLLKARCVVEVKSGYRDHRKRGRAIAMLADACFPDIYAEIIFVNKQVYNEAVPILYSENAFIAGSPTAVTFFINTIGASIRHLRHVGFDRTYPPIKTPFRTMISGLKSAKNLKTLEIPCSLVDSTNRFRPYYHNAEALFDDLMPLVWHLNLRKRSKTEKTRTAYDVLSVRVSCGGYQNGPKPMIWRQHAENLEEELAKMMKGMEIR